MSDLSLETTLFNEKLAMPTALAPVGLCGMYARRGEVQAAGAADDKGIPFTLSTVSVCPIEEVAPTIKRPMWFRLYVLRDRGFMRNALERAKAAGCSTLVFTVDMPTPGARYPRRPFRHRRPERRPAPLLAGRHPSAVGVGHVGLNGRPARSGQYLRLSQLKPGGPSRIGWLANNDPSISWKAWSGSAISGDGPMVIKGIPRSGGRPRCGALRAGGVVVSGHGDRQLDGVSPRPAPCRQLPTR